MPDYFVTQGASGGAVRLPFPDDLPLAKRAAYAAKPPAAALAAAEPWPFSADAQAATTPPADPAPTPED